ncbi:hypothetical protein KFL_006500010 [Klebsormidium nitens]|uniref:CW-type domain-containing protein n=1 Tax=Klebsormidium nitens TaxID=105231 RepID=A0A1Y1IPG6_KLENI|nr:hypothetical protein KFL_006500010 [Klebsormidium nitens]|eukprot:GAQ90507.1 hypothetical protein KFL_006500010 [Klebsormidium nitens]
MASLHKEPLEMALARAFGEGGPLAEVYVGKMRFSKLILGICGKLERLKTFHADEIASIKKGFEEEKKELLGLTAAAKGQPTTARQVEAQPVAKTGVDEARLAGSAAEGRPGAESADVATLRGLQAQVAELRAELEACAAAQEESVTGIQVVAAQGARSGCPSCQAVKATVGAWRAANGLAGAGETVASAYAKLDLRDREALLAILDLEKAAPAAGPHDAPPVGDELTAEGLLERMTDASAEGVKLRGGSAGAERDARAADGDVDAGSSRSSDETWSYEEEQRGDSRGSAAVAQLAALSEALDAEAEALNLRLTAERGVVGAPERSDWAQEAKEARVRRAAAEARARGGKAKAASSKPLNEPSRPPSRLGRLPVKTARYSDSEYDFELEEAPPARKRPRPDSLRPLEERPSMPPLTPSPTWKLNAQPDWKPAGPSPRAVLGLASPQAARGGAGSLPTPRVTKALGGADFVRELDAFCKPKHGKDGPRFEGKLRIWKSGEVVMFCRCDACTAKHGPEGVGMSPVEFEVHAGRGATKKWRHSIWVAYPQLHGPPHESTIEKCEELNGGKNLTPVGLTAPGAATPRPPPPPPAMQRHADQLVQCKSCGKWRRFRRAVPSDFARAARAAADPDWKCADHYDASVASCHIPEERSSRNRRPGCEACYFSELGCAKCRDCTGCNYCRPAQPPEVELLE